MCTQQLQFVKYIILLLQYYLYIKQDMFYEQIIIQENIYYINFIIPMFWSWPEVLQLQYWTVLSDNIINMNGLVKS